MDIPNSNKLDDGDWYEVELISPSDIELDIESEIAEEHTPRAEGAIRHYYGKRYERDPHNRKRAIEIHGSSCIISGSVPIVSQKKPNVRNKCF